MTERVIERDIPTELTTIIRQGILGDISPEQMTAGLDDLRADAAGQRFTLEGQTDNPVAFCAGSWAITGEVFGSREVTPIVTLLAETDDGPLAVPISRTAPNFVIRAFSA